jgi:uncharacterized protein YbjT (DUF2867 family)
MDRFDEGRCHASDASHPTALSNSVFAERPRVVRTQEIASELRPDTGRSALHDLHDLRPPWRANSELGPESPTRVNFLDPLVRIRPDNADSRTRPDKLCTEGTRAQYRVTRERPGANQDLRATA